MLWKDVPEPTPNYTRVWCGGIWQQFGRVDRDHPESLSAWYAVPVLKTADPKASQAIQKPQLQLIPPALSEETAKALERGAVKYGPWNWRENEVEIMTYLGAMKRHIDKLINGEDIDPDTGAHHLGCVAAGCGIVLDARQHGTLVDNRPPKKQTP